VYVRNQRLNASQETHQLEPDGWGLGCSAHPHQVVRGTSRPVRLAGKKAAVKACGVAAAMLQGHSWTPTPSKGSGVNVGTSAPRGVRGSCRGERTRPLGRRSAPAEAEGSPKRGTPSKVGAVLTTPGRVSTVRWPRVRQARQDGVTRVNQCSNAPQDVRQLEPDGSGLVSSAQSHREGGRTRRSVWFAVVEATVKVYGVTVAMLQGQSWAPRLSNDPRMNVGTTRRSRPGPPRWAGREDSLPVDADGVGRGPVVVRAQESCAHGEGVQRTRWVESGSQEPPVNTGDPSSMDGHWEPGTSQLSLRP
jgi:hypothetical protein